jgi:chromosome segregation protein
MHINRLRLLGFKSFVEPTELIVEHGLTGVVGPNGCGKSNLLEALRWVMGESSHKSMRAASMDDVIFSGTNMRPSRNSAEVTIFIDNSARAAPAEFNDSDVLEVTRRIEREMGSAYRINGRDVRARDVKILFEDASTGARSPSLVRQGQIGEIVNAKPEQRRRILEDAAGIAGLHSRRHEAQLRLQAAEGNLARLNEILGQLNSQIESLKRQARQARRYKELSAEIRKTDALAHHLSWVDSQALVDADEASLAEALLQLGVATQSESEALRREGEAADQLPTLREQEAARAAVLHRLKIEQENFDREAARTAERQRELVARVDQLKRDLQRETALVGEARDTLLRLAAEAKEIEATSAAAVDFERDALAAYDAAQATLKSAESQLSELTTATAEARAHRKSLETQKAECLAQAAKHERQLAALEIQMREIIGRAPDATKLKSTSELGQRLMYELSSIESQAMTAEEQAMVAATEAARRREIAGVAKLDASRLRTEIDTLGKLLRPTGDLQYPPILDQLAVVPGYELALGAALGDDLDAPAVADAPVHWELTQGGRDDPALPEGVEPLSSYVQGPSELTRRLRQIGLIDRVQGALLRDALKPGQRLVSREGDLWRWDGFIAAANGITAAATRLAERNRLGLLEVEESKSSSIAAEAARAEADANEHHRAAEAEERRLRQLWRETQARLAQTRDLLSSMERQARETETKLAAVTEAKGRAHDGLAELRKKLTDVETALANAGSLETLEAELAALQTETATRRSSLSDAKSQLITLEREHQMRTERAKGVAADCERWITRSSGAEQQIAALGERIAEATSELDALADLPAKIDAQRQRLFTELANADQHRQRAGDLLAAADTSHRQAVQALRVAQNAVAESREGRARIEAKLEGARQRRSEEARKIREAFDCTPEGCLALAGLRLGVLLPTLVEVERTLQRFKSERERLGGVNLQADDELVVLTEQFEVMNTEKLDVEAAIAKLRSGIGQINREAKVRLQNAFEAVNTHFQRLFTTLFGGGEARLEMIESEVDPLEGGLEIIAKPPGKKPATLSLLSGGEQTLTALSLIFAVFLTNPSPICVLDEVDAPLDDANVDRFCTLMERMSSETATRFLVITHHPMTMARMNRLFGVTMAEKGVSQLVSVDLETAQKFTSSVAA